MIQASPFVPRILALIGTTVWSVGGVGTVTWSVSFSRCSSSAPPGLTGNGDTSSLPDHPGLISAVWLYTTSEFGSAVFVATLATNIDPRAGSVSFPVPDDLESRDYFVMGEVFSFGVDNGC